MFTCSYTVNYCVITLPTELRWYGTLVFAFCVYFRRHHIFFSTSAVEVGTEIRPPACPTQINDSHSPERIPGSRKRRASTQQSHEPQQEDHELEVCGFHPRLFQSAVPEVSLWFRNMLYPSPPTLVDVGDKSRLYVVQRSMTPEIPTAVGDILVAMECPEMEEV